MATDDFSGLVAGLAKVPRAGSFWFSAEGQGVYHVDLDNGTFYIEENSAISGSPTVYHFDRVITVREGTRTRFVFLSESKRQHMTGFVSNDGCALYNMCAIHSQDMIHSIRDEHRSRKQATAVSAEVD